MISVAIMGYGTIGSGVAEVLDMNRDTIGAGVKEEIAVKYILDLRDFPGDKFESLMVKDFQVIVNDPEVRIVVETMGGLKPAYDFVKNSLLAGKHVVTSNKALVAAYGTELLQIAREKNVNFFFEASVGGGIPLIRPLTQSLKGEKILEISGILNGTTNYILTKMSKEGQNFEDALKKAQELGYAERNPEADIEGHDTCRKISILTSLATGKFVDFENVYTEGITKITAEDFKYAEKLGTAIKLFGTSRAENGKVSVYVCPVMIGSGHTLYAVSDVFNGVMVKGNTVGKIMFYGSGAGKLPTANAVVADIVEIAEHINMNKPFGWQDEKQEICPMEDTTFGYFVRIAKAECPEDKAKEIFGDVQIVELDGKDEYAILTGSMTERVYQSKAAEVSGIRQMIRCDL